jgi:FlaA1/EpsC-like NDP-sugar epimerase
MRFRLVAALPVYLTLYTVSLTVAFLLRFDLRMSAETWRTLFAVLPFTLLIKSIVFVMGREWNRYHRYTTMSDLAYIIGLRTIGSLLVFSFFSTGISDVVPPRSVMAIDWVLSILGTIVLRASIRYVREQYGLQMRKCERKRTLVYGADINAVSIVRLLRTTAADHEIVAFLDPFDSAEQPRSTKPATCSSPVPFRAERFVGFTNLARTPG